MIFSDLFPVSGPADWRLKRAGLSRITELMRLLGDPQKSLRCVHVAGTNGKGSVCAMLSPVLTAAGLRTGLFISPHLRRVNERIQIDGREITDGALAEVAAEVETRARQMADAPTVFERLTAMALVYFHLQRCDIAVLEVGMGGRLDATNVIPCPMAAVICNIALDHTEILGDTVPQIAAEKAGIIKPEGEVVLLSQSREAEAVVRQACESRRAHLTVTDPGSERETAVSLRGQTLDYRARKGVRLGLLGEYQYRNAAAVLDTVDVLRRRGLSVPESAVRQGLLSARWPGRFEVLREEPLFLLDGAHNPDGVRELTAGLRQYVPGKKLIFVMGVMADKDYREMLREIAPCAARFFTVTPPNDRALPAGELKALIESETALPAEDAGTPAEGVAAALRVCGPEDAVCAFGSLFQAADVRACFGRE